MRRVKTAVLISGRGSNLQALLTAARADGFPAEIALVISNKADAQGLTHAREAGVATRVIPHTDYVSREAFDAALDEALRADGIQLVCLAGFMRVLSEIFVRRWEGRLINIHPSLLPAYRGLDTHARVLAAKETRHGATVHWVTPELDAGEIIMQEALDVLPGESAAALQNRVQAIEHRLYPLALRKVAGRIAT